jgi:heterodisulfide reductase subunit A-like polyferredoxin
MAKKEIKNKNKVKAKETGKVAMSDDMKKLLQKKTADSYVDFAVKSSLSPAEKRFVTRQCLKKQGLQSKYINYARNRHPYWKKNKDERGSRKNQGKDGKIRFQ